MKQKTALYEPFYQLYEIRNIPKYLSSKSIILLPKKPLS